MKWLLYLLIGIFFAFSANAQSKRSKKHDKQSATETQTVFPLSTAESAADAEFDPNEVVIEPDSYAMPNGGQTDFNIYVGKNMHYPKSALADGVQGKVMVLAIIGPDGRVIDAEVQNGVRDDLDEEALRLVREMPVWNPAKLNGRAVATKAVVMVPFVINRNPEPFK